MPAVSRPPPGSASALDWLLLVCLFVGETVVLVQYATNQINSTTFLGTHLGLSLTSALVGCSWLRPKKGALSTWDRLTLSCQMAVWTVLAGSLGIGIAAMMLLPRRTGDLSTKERHRTSVGPADRAVRRFELIHGTLIDQRLRIVGAHRVRPLLDVILEGELHEKFDALSLISKRYAPDFAIPLKQALGDGEASVRVLAATVMARQHSAFGRHIGALRTAVAAEPEHSAHWANLGRAHLDYAQSGLLDAAQADTEAGHSCEAFSHDTMSRAPHFRPDGVGKGAT